MAVKKDYRKFISWNVNGIRAVLKKGFLEFVGSQAPDFLCLQEVKATRDQAGLDMLLPDYQHYWNPAEKKGYAGVALLSKIKPISVAFGMGIEKHDKEGRVLTAEYDPFYLVNVYTPNSKRGLERLPYRYREWDTDFLAYVKKLEKKKPVVFCGDLNVAHCELDLANPQSNCGNHGFTDEERDGFENILKAGFIDSFREFCQDGGHYTWWSPMSRARERNIGWRIDYFCLSKALRPQLQDAAILSQVMGSDHCPVSIHLSC
ncbi:MAG: exodeoxyribonuclease III [Omnitrophica bacterium GWA2_52_8]|nr:MAG: exodeoxyribonuclease III [Omnitrophica bacterium GWA2_52_8]